MAIGLAIAGGMSLLSAIADSEAAKRDTRAKEAQADFNRGIAFRNAKLATQQAEQEAKDIRQRTRSQVGSAIAASAASGTISTHGSDFIAQTQVAFEGEKEALTALRRGEISAQGFRTEAGFRSFERDVAGEFGKTKQKQSLLRGIGGASQLGFGLNQNN